MILYEQIHRYHAERKSARWIADRLKINPRTVKKYLSMSQAEFERHSDNINRKGFKLQRYTTSVVERLRKYQDTPAAQMHDLLKEHYPDFPAVSPKTVYNYVMKIRQEHGLPAVSASERQYSCIPETAPGRYAQVDFGQMKLRKGDGTRIRVYFMVMILCGAGSSMHGSRTGRSPAKVHHWPMRRLSNTSMVCRAISYMIRMRSSFMTRTSVTTG